MKSNKLIIVGNTSNAKLACHYFTTDSSFNVIGFTVNKQFITEPALMELPVFPFEDIEKSYPPDEISLFIAVGYSKMNKVRERLYYEAKNKGYFLPNYISSKCSFLTHEAIGNNNLILEDNTIQPFVKIGSNNVFWSGNHIGHDGVIGDHNFITSHVVISGFVKIKNNCFIGVNATIRDAITINNETLIAAGAIIMKDTVEKGVYLPARSILFDKKSDEFNIS